MLLLGLGREDESYMRRLPTGIVQASLAEMLLRSVP